MTGRTILASALAFAVALTAAATGASGGPAARLGPQSLADAGLPDALRRAVIATRSDSTGEIAGARVGETGTYVVYVRTEHGCGSGGCRAQIWRRAAGEFVRGESLPVGRLPIVVLPQMSNGMPLLGVTVQEAWNARPVIVPVRFDGRAYSQASDRHLSATSGRTLLTRAMLRPF